MWSKKATSRGLWQLFARHLKMYVPAEKTAPEEESRVSGGVGGGLQEEEEEERERERGGGG